ncbi:MAG: hypothetical protein KF912_03060 [Phycisphaeraceae bacterium]|nr:hypothetical protein [Phycisphaeraceae bacterium]MBX3366279.1 hypothetical protein [Phycisphaeraceae bacterium]QYK48735.1 MAG: hypothetical protein KF838_02530 [Phycisphaeraceae bacterium]
MQTSGAHTHPGWQPHPNAAHHIQQLLHRVLDAVPLASQVAARLTSALGVRLADLTDHMVVPQSDAARNELFTLGFCHRPQPGAPNAYTHDAALLPTVILSPGSQTRLAIRVDSIADFLAAWHIGPDHTISGAPGSPFRIAQIAESGHSEFAAVERHGYRGLVPPPVDPAKILCARIHAESFQRRPRTAPTETDQLTTLAALIETTISDIGQDWACDIFFSAERDYWRRRCSDATAEHAAREEVGIGWSDRDSHAYFCSERTFTPLVAILERLGLHRREWISAPNDGGSGVLVMEQPVADIVALIHTDSDSDSPLASTQTSGPIASWCAAHGESPLSGGMQRLACRSSLHGPSPDSGFPAHRADRLLADLPFFKSALAPPRVPDPARCGSSAPTSNQLERVERNDGYRGFNREAIGAIVREA